MKVANAIELITNSSKPVKYTYGFKYRNPTTYEKPITKEEAIAILNDGNWAMFDLNEREDFFDLNMYSSNDMW